ncbi:hypothetical protein AXX17_AT1G30700 [Arabidopsis thaliana]|uniref:Uncharacterized protein n=1 Tax=Arabidopsis thaliana TaxID=3702 RepID=A0A178W2W2_ARATH|nr:hypothetical protein AXX17_AT1G30700 [Arabidopsis thaliana]
MEWNYMITARNEFCIWVLSAGTWKNKQQHAEVETAQILKQSTTKAVTEEGTLFTFTFPAIVSNFGLLSESAKMQALS